MSHTDQREFPRRACILTRWQRGERLVILTLSFSLVALLVLAVILQVSGSVAPAAASPPIPTLSKNTN